MAGFLVGLLAGLGGSGGAASAAGGAGAAGAAGTTGATAVGSRFGLLGNVVNKLGFDTSGLDAFLGEIENFSAGFNNKQRQQLESSLGFSTELNSGSKKSSNKFSSGQNRFIQKLESGQPLEFTDFLNI